MRRFNEITPIIGIIIVKFKKKIKFKVSLINVVQVYGIFLITQWIETTIECHDHYQSCSSSNSLIENHHNFLALKECYSTNHNYNPEYKLNILWSLFLFIPGLAVGARRLHDVNRSGWWQLLILTVIGIFLLLFWYCTKSDQGENNFGNLST